MLSSTSQRQAEDAGHELACNRLDLRTRKAHHACLNAPDESKSSAGAWTARTTSCALRGSNAGRASTDPTQRRAVQRAAAVQGSTAAEEEGGGKAARAGASAGEGSTVEGRADASCETQVSVAANILCACTEHMSRQIDDR